MYIESVPNRNSKPAILLREGRREGGKIVKRTIANLSALPAEAIDALRQSLKGVKLCDASKAFAVKSTVPCGHVKAIRKAMERLGMAELVSSKPCRERDIVLALIAQRLIEPCSKLALSHRFRLSTAAADFNLPADVDENDVYAAMDWLAGRQPFIEKKLAARHLDDGSMAFYDLSCSSYYGSHCELARRGYNRDGLKLPSVEYGLLTDREGRPVSVQVYPGNAGDPKTVPDQAAKLKKDFGLKRVVLVGDRGMLTGTQIDELREDNAFGWISCLRSDDIRKLLEDRDPSGAPLFTKGYLAEISHPDFPGERLVACFNPFLKEDRTRTRNELLAATEAKLAQLQVSVARRKAKPMSDGELGEKMRVKAHIFLCMLTYYVEWHMRRALSSLMYVEDDLPAARAERDPVAKARPTAEAGRKKRTGLSKDGYPLLDWRGIMALLGTISRTTIESGGIPVVMDTEPTGHQARIFELLSAEGSCWKRRCSQ